MNGGTIYHSLWLSASDCWQLQILMSRRGDRMTWSKPDSQSNLRPNLNTLQFPLEAIASVTMLVTLFRLIVSNECYYSSVFMLSLK